MTEISDTVYRETAGRLLTAIGEAAWFNGSVEVETDRSRSILRCTLIIYREEIDDPQGRFSRIREVAPVWWEFETADEQGATPNDFSWRTFREYLW